MTDKKLTNNEIIKVLECCSKPVSENCKECPLHLTDCLEVNIEKLTLDLITCLQAENEKLVGNIDKLKAEIERLKNAYKQCAWERDIFAEDIKQEIKKDCSYLMLDIKNIKAEAYKECVEKVKEKASKTEYVCSGALVKTDYTITDKELDKLLKEVEVERGI